MKTIHLPISKSIAQRYMLIGAVCHDPYYLSPDEPGDDLRAISQALSSVSETVNVGESGTALRFLTAYFATQNKPRIITGSERLSQRPIGPLVEALRHLGATISDGWPLRICGPLTGDHVTLDTSLSSQFLSALMLVAPTLPKGLTIELTGEMVSEPYIRITERVMSDCGVTVERNGKTVTIPHQTYTLPHHAVEADWSAAAFFYEVVSLHPSLELRLEGLSDESWQGDDVVYRLFELFGVRTTFDEKGAVLKNFRRCMSASTDTDKPMLTINFTSYPDLFMATAATACAWRMPFCFTGLTTLQHKESRRLTAMYNALKILGFGVTIDEAKGVMRYDGKWVMPKKLVEVDGCNDHRIVMALTPLQLVADMMVDITSALSVSKSFPGFWYEYNRALGSR